MAIEVGRGNLLTQDVDALVNTVNTEGVMGKGIALQFKKAWPAMYDDYVEAVKRGDVVVGRMHVWETGLMTGPRFIINFPTKRHWRSQSRLEDVAAGLMDLRQVIEDRGITSVAVPPLGCGNGALNWRDVEPLIRRGLAPLEQGVRIILYEPAGAPGAAAQPNREVRPRLTGSRAALLALMREYERVTFEAPTLIEVQKLAYFLQLSGEPLRLRFVKASYGPYADDLRKSLRSMEGHYIIGFGDGSSPVTQAEPIRVMSEVSAELDGYLADHPDVLERVGEVLGEIEGYESAYGLELLATVHWVMTHDRSATASAGRAHSLVRDWNSRKSSLFTAAHVASAWRVVRSRGLVVS